LNNLERRVVMKRLEAFIALAVATFPIISVSIVLWSDVQNLKTVKADYREVAEIKTEFVGQLSKNTEAINNLNKTIEHLLDERRIAYEPKAGSY